jgi:hypothetical protein
MVELSVNRGDCGFENVSGMTAFQMADQPKRQKGHDKQ